MYTHRFYRTWVSHGDLCRFRIVRHESDLHIAADCDLSMAACDALHRVRRELEGYADGNEAFLHSLVPVTVPPSAPEVAVRMAEASSLWGVGPMASVAGAVAESVGRALEEWTDTVIVENGGDIFARSAGTLNFVLYAGEDSPFSGRIGFRIHAPDGKGVCTSSGTVGHSLSFGRAGAVTVVAGDCAEADAAATAIANMISAPGDLEETLERVSLRGSVEGVVACCGRSIVSRGVRLLPVEGREGA
ncbi:MAG: hypothetical protein AVO35_06675 [Candidatus Aegiribacteria sp. MLS_C]|nr:MAG: hypothetical protein AVO35_06675 [Candidatus Aegiribacteria sp. MLS_C]